MRGDRLLGIIIRLLIVGLFLGYVAISFNSRYQFDDMAFSSMVKRQGVWNSFTTMYSNWETTYNTLFLFLLLKLVYYVQPFVFNISILIMNIFTFFLLLHAIGNRLKIELKKPDALMLASLVILIAYFACRAEGNAIFWVTGQIVYWLFLSFLFLGLYFWQKRQLIVAGIFLFFFGHTRINYDAIFIALYFCYWISPYFIKYSLKFRFKEQIPFLFFIAGMLSYVIIPGNYVRVENFKGTHPFNNLNCEVFLSGWFVAMKHLIMKVLTSWRQIIILPIGIVLGFILKNNKCLYSRLNFRFVLLSSLSFLICYWAQSTVLIISIGTPVGYGRIFVFLELLLFVLFILWGLYLSFTFDKLMKDGKIKRVYVGVLIVCSLTILISLGDFIFKNILTTRQFARAYDQRIELLLHSNLAKNQILIVNPLPASGIIKYMEISSEPENGKYPGNNAAYTNFYNLPFEIYLKK